MIFYKENFEIPWARFSIIWSQKKPTWQQCLPYRISLTQLQSNQLPGELNPILNLNNTWFEKTHTPETCRLLDPHQPGFNSINYHIYEEYKKEWNEQSRPNIWVVDGEKIKNAGKSGIGLSNDEFCVTLKFGICKCV
jgi:hypothetical protein